VDFLASQEGLCCIQLVGACFGFVLLGLCCWVCVVGFVLLGLSCWLYVTIFVSIRTTRISYDFLCHGKNIDGGIVVGRCNTCGERRQFAGADHLIPVSETLGDRLIIERRAVGGCSTGCRPLHHFQRRVCDIQAITDL